MGAVSKMAMEKLNWTSRSTCYRYGPGGVSPKIFSQSRRVVLTLVGGTLIKWNSPTLGGRSTHTYEYFIFSCSFPFFQWEVYYFSAAP